MRSPVLYTSVLLCLLLMQEANGLRNSTTDLRYGTGTMTSDECLITKDSWNKVWPWILIIVAVAGGATYSDYLQNAAETAASPVLPSSRGASRRGSSLL